MIETPVIKTPILRSPVLRNPILPARGTTETAWTTDLRSRIAAKPQAVQNDILESQIVAMDAWYRYLIDAGLLDATPADYAANNNPYISAFHPFFGSSLIAAAAIAAIGPDKAITGLVDGDRLATGEVQGDGASFFNSQITPTQLSSNGCGFFFYTTDTLDGSNKTIVGAFSDASSNRLRYLTRGGTTFWATMPSDRVQSDRIPSERFTLISENRETLIVEVYRNDSTAPYATESAASLTFGVPTTELYWFATNLNDAAAGSGSTNYLACTGILHRPVTGIQSAAINIATEQLMEIFGRVP